MYGVNIVAVNALELLITYLVTDWKRNFQREIRDTVCVCCSDIPFLCFVR